MNSIALVNSFSCQQLGKSEERIYEVKYVRVNIQNKIYRTGGWNTGWYARIFQDWWNTWLHRFKSSMPFEKTTCGYIRKLQKWKVNLKKTKKKKTCQLKRQLTVS